MNAYQRDLGFLLLVKHGTNPFRYQEIAKAREEILSREAETHTVAELEWLSLSKRLPADMLIEDNIIKFINFTIQDSINVYKLTDEFIEELKNEK